MSGSRRTEAVKWVRKQDMDLKCIAMTSLHDNTWILSACSALVGETRLTARESRLLDGVSPLPESEAQLVADAIRSGGDPLGDAYMLANATNTRRSNGETYTPKAVVDSMMEMASSIRTPNRVVDAGCGSGRFTVAAASMFHDAKIIAIDSSPMATLMTKAAVSVLGLENQVEVRLGDFTTMRLAKSKRGESTLWLGNPPYVRHHDISAKSKQWLADVSTELGFKASGLSGLHAYFVLAIAKRLAPDDFGLLITSAEWMDVKYGGLIRSLLTKKLGLGSLLLFDKSQSLFSGTDTTSVIFAFDARCATDADRSVSLSLVSDEPHEFSLPLSELISRTKWSPLFAGSVYDPPDGYVRLGDFARVHRGIVTGDNKFWVRTADDEVDVPTIPVVTHASELMECDGALDSGRLSKLIVLPYDLDGLEGDAAVSAHRIVDEGRRRGVDKGYVAKSRKCWWSIPIGEPATILMTYMARKAPRFVINREGVRSLNVVHGIYPLIDMSERAVSALVNYLNTSVSLSDGRIYCGGLTKFEPREVENLWVPSPTMLEEGSWSS